MINKSTLAQLSNFNTPVLRRRRLAAGCKYCCSHMMQVRQQRLSLLSCIAPLIETEVTKDNEVLHQLVQIVHALCLGDADVGLLATQSVSAMSMLCAAPLVNRQCIAIVVPYLLPLLRVLNKMSPLIQQSTYLLLSTLCKDMQPNTKNRDHLQQHIRIALEERSDITIPLLLTMHAMHLGDEYAPLVVSTGIVSSYYRALVSRFLRCIISQNSFHQQWSDMILFLLYTYILDENSDARQCLNILLSRPGNGLGYSIRLLLAATIEVSTRMWSRFSQAVKNNIPKLSCHPTFNIVGKNCNSSVSRCNSTTTLIVRYASTKQRALCSRIFIRSLETTISVFINHVNFTSTCNNLPKGGNNGKQRISLSVLAGVQALIRSSVSDDNRDVDVVLLRLALRSQKLTEYLLSQLATSKKNDLISRLKEISGSGDAIVSLNKSTTCSRFYHVPRRPKLPAPPRRSQLRQRFTRKRPSTAKPTLSGRVTGRYI